MHLLSRVLVIFIISLISVALTVAPAQAQCDGPFLELSPSSGVPGTGVIIHGYDFAGGVLVDVYYDGNLVAPDNRTSSSGDFTFFFIIPEGGRGHYQVLAQGRYASIDTYFTVKPGLAVSPEKGLVATTVTVKGQGFAANEQDIELMYYLNGDYETIARSMVANAQGSWETSFQIPQSTRGEHKLDAEGAISRLYEVQDTIFRVTGEISLDKSSGIVGDIITMTGSRFAANEKGIKILFDGQAIVTDIRANFEGEWEASFAVPEMPTGHYSITAEGEQTKKEDIGEISIEIEPDIVLSAYEGHVGMDLTVTGHGFSVNEDVTIAYDGNQVETTATNGQGSFEVSFSVPESPHGEHLVTAGYSASNAANAVFIMESEPPDTPYLISPPNKGRVGLRGKITPTFEWSEVFDDSGVRYRLQIATSSNVNDTGEFVAALISKENLVGTNYTLEETEALPYGTYYWIVQAVDRADNVSGWTATHSFGVGLLPLWAFIAVIVAGVLLFIVLIRALVIRRTIYYDRW